MATHAPSSEPERDDVLGPREIARPEGRVEEARKRGLGHHARKPSEIPPPGWWQVLKRVWAETISDQMSIIAAGCAFYALLALFPAISVLISLYGLALDPTAIGRQLEAVRDVLPAAAYELVAQRVHELAAKGATTLSWGLALGVLVALWSASAGTKALIMSLNIAYEEEEKRGIVRYHLTALFFTLCGVFGVSLALSVIVGLPAVLQLDVLGALGRITARVVSSLLLLGFVTLGLALLYRFAPSRQEAAWHWITPGSALAAVLWLLASVLFSLYVSRLASYDTTYGSLGAVVVVLFWFYISAFVVLLGAELNAELELQTKRDTTTGPERPMGERGAFVADHVAMAE
jgi:membrane protein